MEGKTLELTILSAEELKQLKWTGKMSPYAVAWVNPDFRVTTKAAAEGGKNPKWNETFELKVEERHFEDSKAALSVEIYSDGPFGPKQLGMVNIPLTEVTKDWKGDSKEPQYMAYQIRRKSGRTQGVLNLAITLQGLTQPAVNGTAPPQVSSSEPGGVESAEIKPAVEEDKALTDEKVATVEKAVTDEKVASESKTSDKPAMAVYPPPAGYAQGYPPAAYAYPPPPAYPIYPVGYAQPYAPVLSPAAYPQGYAPPPAAFPQAYPQGYAQAYPPPAQVYPQGYPPQPYPVAYGGYPPPPQYYAPPAGQYPHPQQKPPKKSGFGGAGLGLGLGAGLLGGVLLGEALDDDCGDC